MRTSRARFVGAAVAALEPGVRLVLTKRRPLSSEELKAATARALQLDRRAHRPARAVYGTTAFATVR